MRKLISFMHISLDGFVAGPNGEMDWIKVDQEIFDHVGSRTRLSDTALYGRVTYEMMESYWPTAADKPNATKHDIEHARWYKEVRKIVLSTTLVAAETTKVKVISADIEQQVGAIKSTTNSDILVFGSPRATHALMRANLIDGYWLFVNPIVLGSGVPLFSGDHQRSNLQLQSCRRFDCGVVALEYVNG
ncbi:MAG: dihydrofolate reductase family protein [Flavobacteriales bacterium]|nr:dihydrofolate reductase family protein [Flavobacteriales bacterium]